METSAFYSSCFCLSNRVRHDQIIYCTVVIYPNNFKCHGTIFAFFLLQKTHYFLERTHQILTPSNVSAARCRLLCRRRRTRGNGLRRQRAICMNGVARNRNILALDEYISWWWLATEHGLSSFESTILPRILISQASGSRKILPC